MTDSPACTVRQGGERICEGCSGIFPAYTPRWYVDPEGIELCPECADDLHAEWTLGGHVDEAAAIGVAPGKDAEACDG